MKLNITQRKKDILRGGIEVIVKGVVYLYLAYYTFKIILSTPIPI